MYTVDIKIKPVINNKIPAITIIQLSASFPVITLKQILLDKKNY